MSSKFAAIDVGTNSINLLITDADGNDLVREVNVERLGENLHATGVLSDAAIKRALTRIAQYKSAIEEHQVDNWRVVITAPGRLARNAPAFLAAVQDMVGPRVEIASGEREAMLSFIGANSTATVAGIGLIDIGGGSTEFVISDGTQLTSFSIPVGAVTLTGKHLNSNPPRPEELTNAIGDVTDHLDDLIQTVPAVSNMIGFVGVAGTIVTVTAVEIGLSQFDPQHIQGFTLTREAAEDVFRTLATESLADRKLNPGLPPERADVIVGGCCILVAFMRKFNLASITVSVRNLLDGVIRELRQER